LQRAVVRDARDTVELLLACGADVGIKDNKDRSPLDWAQNLGHIEIVELLRKNGAKE
jgi:ankyrin repeat protein